MPFKFFPPLQPIGRGRQVTPARRKRLIFSYLPDWLLTIILAALFFSLDKVDGFRREFSLADTSLRHPYAVHERVPNSLLLVIAFVVPFCIMPVVNFITVRSLWDFHNASLGLILGLALTGSVTQTVKITVGRPRPDVISRCQPIPGSEDPIYKLSNSTICQQTDNAIMMDGFRSFLSGHSSLSFAGLGFLAFYLAGKLHLFDKRGHTGKAWLALFPFLGAALVAISRSMDYRHHWQDILVGSLLGTVLAFFSYRQYYPSLASPLSHRPYAPRIPSEDPDDDDVENKPVIPMHHSHSRNPSVNLGGAPVNTKYNQSYDDLTPDYGYQRQHGGSSERLNEDGTVQRPGHVNLQEVWKDGDGDEAMVNRRNNSTHGLAGNTYPPPPQPRNMVRARTGSAGEGQSNSRKNAGDAQEVVLSGSGSSHHPAFEVQGMGVMSPTRNEGDSSAVMNESTSAPPGIGYPPSGSK